MGDEWHCDISPPFPHFNINTTEWSLKPGYNLARVKLPAAQT